MSEKHKVSDLIGDELDLAVLLADGWEPKPGHRRVVQKPPVVHYGVAVPCERHAGGFFEESTGTPYGYQPSVEWRHAGPIIERERIELRRDINEPPNLLYTTDTEPWYAECRTEWAIGATALIAAMRAYVASKFGEEVELPRTSGGSQRVTDGLGAGGFAYSVISRIAVDKT